MAMSRDVALVAVGVDSTGVLPKLNGAASGAEHVATWLREQGRFGVASSIHLLTDHGGAKVDIRAVQDAVQAVIDRASFDLLILYFAGHGIVKSGGDEQLLLSDVARYNHEAINIAATWANARACPIPHVLIISDACRNTVDPFSRLGQITGVPALNRGSVVGVTKAKVDLFYATEPSQTAKEYKGEGFFTDVFLSALKTCPPGLCEEWQGLDSMPVIPAWRLEEYLYNEVPLLASKHDPPFEQSPDILVTSRIPQFVGFGVQNVPSEVGTHETRGRGRRSPTWSMPDNTQDKRQRDALPRILSAVELGDIAQLKDRLQEDPALSEYVTGYIGRMQMPQSPVAETACVVRGSSVVHALLAGEAGVQALHVENNANGAEVRLPESTMSTPPGSLVLWLSDDTVTVLPVLPGHSGTLSVNQGRVEAFALDVAQDMALQLGLDDSDRELLLWRRAFASALAATGKLRQLGRDNAHFSALFLCQNKYIDPTLGIYGAYAYALAGNDDGVRMLLKWFAYFHSLHSRFPGRIVAAIPFDVAMLAGELRQPIKASGMRWFPFCPLMSLGWSLMASYTADEAAHPAVLEAGRHRLNAEWTTFRSADIAPVVHALEKGEL